MTKRLLSINGHRTVDSFHRELGKIVWDYCGMSRNAPGLERALDKIRELREEYWRDVSVPGSAEELNQSLEKAGRVADFFELAELMCIDALDRNESCGGHFREEYQTPDGEALRDDDDFSYVAAWEYQGPGRRRPCTRSRSRSSTCIRASGVTSNAPDPPHLAAEERRRTRAHGALRRGDVNPDMSMLEMLDVLNEGLILKGEEPIAFEHDCREGICGSCGFMINGIAHGPLPATTVCQLTCATFRTATSCTSSRGAPGRFRSSRI